MSTTTLPELSGVERALDNALVAYDRLEKECAAAHRAAKRNWRAFLMVSVIAFVGWLSLDLVLIFGSKG